MFRLFQLLTVLAIVPMMLLGLMSGFSGGGSNPVYQRVGGWLLVNAPIIAIVCLIIAEILWRANQAVLAQVVCAIPALVWFGLLAWLQYKTGFFYRPRKRQ